MTQATLTGPSWSFATSRRTLEKEGWQVREAANGRLGLEQVMSQAPDVIVLDLMMPQMDGFEFVNELRRNSKLRTIPIVVLAAKELTDGDRAQLNSSVARVLQKGGQQPGRTLGRGPPPGRNRHPPGSLSPGQERTFDAQTSEWF